MIQTGYTYEIKNVKSGLCVDLRNMDNKSGKWTVVLLSQHDTDLLCVFLLCSHWGSNALFH